MSTNDLPISLRGQQAFDASDDQSYDDLYNFIMSADIIKRPETVNGSVNTTSENSTTLASNADVTEPEEVKVDLESQIFSSKYDSPDEENIAVVTEKTATVVSGTYDKKPTKFQRWQASRRIYKKYYLVNPSTLLLPFFFVTLALLIFLQQFHYFSFKENAPANIGVYVLILGVISGAFFLLKSHIAKKTAISSSERTKPFIIRKYDSTAVLRRKEQQDQLEHFLDRAYKERKHVYIVGKSGCGKSLLLDEYRYKHQGAVHRFESNDYARESALEDLKREIVKIIERVKDEKIKRFTLIFDQYESAYEKKLVYRNIIRLVKWLQEQEKSNIPICLVFVTTKQDYPEIAENMKEMLKEIYTSKFVTHNIRFTKEERLVIREQLESQLNLEKGDVRRNYFKDLLNDLMSGNATMIDVNIARNYFGDSLPAEYENVLKHEYPRDLIMEDYFEKVFASIEEPSLALVMLYAICKYQDGLTITDFQNLTFASADEIKVMLGILEKQEIIKKIDNVSTSPYTTTHDYLAEYLDIYCSKKLSEQVSINIVFYCKEKAKFRERKLKNELTGDAEADNKKSLSNDIPLSKYYISAVEKKTSTSFISVCMVLLGVIVTAICAWNEINGYGAKYFFGFEYPWDHFTHALTILAAGSAIFYVYHYLQYFTKIFFCKKYSPEWWICGFLIFGGMTLISLALIHSVLWAAWIALGWSIIGVLHLYLATASFSNENSQKRLQGEGILYLIVAAVIIGLNIMSLWLEGNMLQYYVLFIVFLLLTIRQHMNTDYMLSKTCVFVNATANVTNKGDAK
jgi:ABC-type polar amino acid transport system ATPase subunit